MRTILCCLLAMLGAHASAAESPPRVALVLGGGGARGAAHIGVLEVLEREHIKVDCVAGTSMGALVAGAYAAGLTPAQMRTQLGEADWNDMFQDNPTSTELRYRNYLISQQFLPGSEMGFGKAGVQYQSGVVVGQKIKLFFNQLVHAERGDPQIEALPLPVALIATDIGTGERVVFRDGSLTQAMRASMSVPGLLAPLEYRGRKLVDGGLVDNLPVREARELCKADVVIAVNVGSPLLKAEEVGSLLTVSAQMVNILTEQNVTQSIASLDKTRDIYLRPDLNGISAGDFARNAETADRGRVAAEAIVPQLRRLAVDQAAYLAWRQRFDDAALPPRRIDAIEIAGLKHVNPEVVKRHITVKDGQAPDTSQIRRDLLRVYGDGDYESVDYSVINEHDKSVLRITPIEKPWGPDYLRFGLKLESVIGKSANFGLRGGLHKTWLNSYGGEMLLLGELGQSSALGLELYQPLDPAQRFFFQPQISYRRTQQSLYVDNWNLAEYQVRKGEILLAAGTSFGSSGQIRAGWSGREYVYTLETGVPLLPEERKWSSGPEVRLDIDNFDRLYFPQKGWSFSGRYFDSATYRYSKLSVEAKGAWTWRDFVLNGQARHISSPQGRLPYYDAATLGGFRNLSGYVNDQIMGDSLSFGSLGVERIIGRMPLGLRGDMRLGATMEAGRVDGRMTELNRQGWLTSNALYLGGETPLGIMYLGWGHARNSSSHWYLFIGTP
ncbi:patatin-like phospholipase family protein [Uliginosibacterium sp. 31-16]|uniref:patatin-like phospholipase family protein n=1 Tax=Uliginosibacterium sp. 31-16 TaxID=3068315 RepID=UPI00273D86D3|nr:patatin-like phospholipase family protein [Uliginosibacterium sp. 31-16]MDP5240419.1 patatin-like phospholipase family protein [Uliginosibacterium sp. 31-16]